MKITQSKIVETYLIVTGRGRLEAKLKALLGLPIKPDSEWRRTEVRRLRSGAECRERLYVKWTGDEMLVHWKTESK